jgi:hypothetical protein
MFNAVFCLRNARIGNYLISSLRPRHLSATGHDSSSAAAPEFTEAEQAIIAKFREQQQAQPRLTVAEEVRTLVQQSIGYGVLSTNSVQYPGYPTGSVVGFW